MAQNRRTFLGTSLTALAGAIVRPRLSAHGDQFLPAVPSRGFMRQDNLVLPPSLTKGSTVAITAPASGVRKAELEDGISFLKAQGMNVVLGKCLTPGRAYLSAPDDARADEFNEFAQRDDIDAILCARGGFGVARILPTIDYDAIRSKPKVIMGYSDITALLIAIYERSRVVTYHGPVCSSTFDATTRKSFTKVTMSNRVGIVDDLREDGLMYQSDDIQVIHEGNAEAALIGGNLSTICSTLGTPFEIDTKDKILFLEDVAEEPYRIDRMLTQLWLSGKFKDIKGVALGIFKSCDAVRRTRQSAMNDQMSHSLKQIFAMRFSDIGVPVLAGLPFGHIKSKLTLPLGVRARLDAKDKSLRLLEASVA